MPTSNLTKKYSLLYPSAMPKGGAVKIFTNVNEMVNRLYVLIGSIEAGNKSNEIKNEIMELLDALLNRGAITKSEHKHIYNKYVK